MAKQPLVSIIVVTMNTPEITRACLESVIRHSSVRYELIVVSNSRAEAIRKTLKKIHGLRVIQNQENLGYTKAANQGAIESRGKFLCFLNSDTIVPPGWLERLLEAASLPGVGAAGAKRWGQPRTKDAAMRLGYTLLADKALKNARQKKFETASRLCGYCIMIPRHVMACQGLFDERFFFGYEDFDYSLQLRVKGYKLLLVNPLFISHIGSASSTLQRHRQLVRVSRKQYLAKWSLFYKKSLRSHQAILSYTAAKMKENKTNRALLEASFFSSRPGVGKSNLFLSLKPQHKMPANVLKSGLIRRPASKALGRVAVSVMMAAHNAEAWIAEAIESVLAQDFSSFELIVVDDGSTDQTAKIVRNYLKNPRLRFYQNKNQLGIPATRNRILKLARGKYIAVCDADDQMRPFFLTYFTNFMEKNPKTGWAYGNRLVVDGSGRPLVITKALAMNGRIEYKRNVMQHAGAMIRKRLMLEAGGYDERFNSCEDYDLAFKIARRAKITALPGEPQYIYRWHPKNTSRNNPWARRETDILVARAKTL